VARARWALEEAGLSLSDVARRGLGAVRAGSPRTRRRRRHARRRQARGRAVGAQAPRRGGLLRRSVEGAAPGDRRGRRHQGNQGGHQQEAHAGARPRRPCGGAAGLHSAGGPDPRAAARRAWRGRSPSSSRLRTRTLSSCWRWWRRALARPRRAPCAAPPCGTASPAAPEPCERCRDARPPVAPVRPQLPARRARCSSR